MNCQQFDQLIVRLSCGQLADPGEALAHAQHCGPCHARLARQQNIADSLQALASDEQTIQAPAHLGAALQAAFAQQVHALQTPAPRRALFQWLNWQFATAAAVLLICAVLTAVWLWPRRTEQLAGNRDGVNKSVNPKPVNPKEATPPLPVEPRQQTSLARAAASKPHPRPRPQNKAKDRNAEEYGALLSLTPLAQSEPDEFQQVVRMQIPRATLRLWGVPLNEESNSAQVSAEVVFGEDGVARAIRLHN